MVEILGHGADLKDAEEKYGVDESSILDFSSNINISLPNLDFFSKEELMKRLSKYPDPYYRKLRDKLGKHFRVNMDWIIPGNGATELIYLVMKSLDLKKVAIVNPTFSEYERAARTNGLEVVDIYYEKSTFTIDLKEISKKLDEIDILIICNPNNPTGKLNDIKSVLDLARDKDVLVFVDETFMEFVEDEKFSLMNELQNYKNLMILGAMTKFFGMPGLRMGYIFTSNQNILTNIWKNKEPWTVNSLAEYLCENVIEDELYKLNSKRKYKELRNNLIKNLKEIKELEVFEGQSNFLLLKSKTKKVVKVKEELVINHKILLRDASNFKGLDESYMRVAIKGEEDNKKLVEGLRNVMEER